MTYLLLAGYAWAGVTGTAGSVGFFTPRLEASDRHVSELWGEFNPCCIVRKVRAEPELGLMRLGGCIRIANTSHQPNTAHLSYAFVRSIIIVFNRKTALGSRVREYYFPTAQYGIWGSQRIILALGLAIEPG